MTTRNPNPLWRRTSRWRNGLLGIAAALFMAPSAFAQCGVGESELSLTTSGGSYASEKWVNITTGANGTGTVIWAQGNGTYGNGAGLVTGVTFCVTNGSTYYINCYDKYADSWDGTVYAITAGPTLVANNGGVSPDGNGDGDASSAWEYPPPSTIELETSESFSYTPPACPPTSSLTATAINVLGADLGWTENGSATAWDLEIGAGGFSPTGTPTHNDVGANPYTWAGGAADTDYDFYVRADCGMDNIDVSAWTGPFSFFTGYCTPAPTSVDNQGIVRVVFSSVDNNTVGTSPEAGNYANFSAMVGDIAQSTTVNVDITYQTGYTYETEIWIDWNDDLDFNDVGENVYSGVSLSGNPTTLNASFAVGTNPLGNHRMRIGGADSGPPTPCYTGSYASYEDYTINVTAPPACLPTSALTATSITTSGADLGWTENGSATAWDIEIGASGFTPTGIPTLDDVGANPYTWAGGSANTAYAFYVRADCGMDNVNVSSWSGPYAFTTLCDAFPVPFQEGFNSASTTQTCWTVLNVNADGDAWSMDYTSNTYEGDQVAAMYTDFNSGANDDWLISPAITLTGAEQLSYQYRVQSGGEPNDMEVLLSTTGTAPGDFTNTLLPLTAFSNTTYAEQVINLTAYSGNVHIAWRLPPGGLDGWRMYVDDVNVEAIPACPDPNTLTATSITSAGADLGWTEIGSATAWDLEIGANGFTPTGTPTHNDVGANPYTWAGGAPTTDYDFYVRADCGMDNVDVSAWVGPFSFTTGCATYTPDYTENFTTYVPNCWEEATGPISGPTSFGFSGWSSGSFGYVGSASAKVEIYFTGGQEWLLSPLFDLSAGGYELNFDVALTAWLSSSADVIEADDAVYLMQSTDGGTTWTTINTWNAGNSPSNTGDNTTIDISAVTSATTQFGFFMLEGGTSGGDKDFYVDNFQVRTPPACPDVSGLMANNLSLTNVDISWNPAAGATNYLWEIQDSPNAQGTPGPIASGSGAGTSAAAAGTYVDGNDYILYVNSVCGGPTGNYQSHAFTLNIPPANDDCGGAYGLTVNPDYACGATTAGTVENATASPESAAACFGTENDDVWFSFVATNSTHRIQLLNIAGSETDMYHSVWEGGCGSLTLLAGSCSDANTSNPTGMTPGYTYFVRVYNYYGGAENTTFDVCVGTPPPPPANDECANAIPLECNSLTLASTVNSTTTGAPATCNFLSLNTAGGIWYTLPGFDGTMTVDLSGSSFDTKVAVFTGSCGSLVCVDSDDDGGTGATSLLTWAGSSAETYTIYVTGYSTYTGSVTMAVTCGDNAFACTENGLTLEFQTDANPGQTTWQLWNEADNLLILSGGPLSPPNSVETNFACVPDGCYRLRVLDSGGDGMTTGGYILRTTGSNLRIIDNKNNFNGAYNGNVSTLGSGAFCFPMDVVNQPIYSSCDKLDWVTNKFIVAAEDPAVTAAYATPALRTSSGYLFWFFDPNGAYSYRRFRKHSESDGYGTGALRANHFRINSWVNTAGSPHLPDGMLLNVRIMGRVNWSWTTWGPACQFKMDAALAACPRVNLQDNPALNEYSCNVNRVFGGSNHWTNRVTASQPQPVPGVSSSLVRYQFRFRIPGEAICIVRPPQTSPRLFMNWSADSGLQLECGKQYEVDVRVSLDGGANWCFDVASPSCVEPVTTWGNVCMVNITTSTYCPGPLQGGSSSMATQNGDLTMYPNPNRGDQLYINLSAVDADVNTVSVDIYDLTGKRISARTIAVQDGFLNSVLDLNGEIASGLYMVNITAGDKTYTERLVIQK